MLVRGCCATGIVEALLRDRFPEIDAVDRADDADDREGRARRTAALNLLADRAPIGEVPLHQILIDHHDRRAVGGVGVVEQAAGDQRDLHRAEVVAADDFLPPVRLRLALRRRVADDRVRAGADVAVERHVRGEADGGHAGQRADLFDEPRPERAARRRRRDSAWRAARAARSARCRTRSPGFTSCSRAKLLISSPAPTSSITASAVSAMTSVGTRHAGALSGRAARRVVLQQRVRVAADHRERRHQAEDQAGHERERHREGEHRRMKRRARPSRAPDAS